MKKQGVVLKIEKNKMILLTDDGEFLEKPVPSIVPSLGAKVTVYDEKPVYYGFKKLSLVAILLVFVLSFSILRPVLMPPAVAAVAFDLPVGVELGVDEKNRVVKVTAKDEQGQALTRRLNLKGKDVYLAANQLVEASFSPKNLAQDQGGSGVLVTVMPLRGQDRMRLDCQLLHENMRQTLDKQSFNGYLVLQDSDEDLREKAAALDMPVAKYLLWQRLSETNSEFNSIEELKALSMDALMPQDEEVLERRFPGMWHQVGRRGGMKGPGHQMNGTWGTELPQKGSGAQTDETKDLVSPQKGRERQQGMMKRGMMR